MIQKIKNYINKRKIEVLKPFSKDLRDDDLKITICGNNTESTSALVDQFSDIDTVSVVLGDILLLDTHALVSPANSFGEMSGGLDKAIDCFYNYKAQKAAMTIIQSKHFGELPVGTAEIFSMNHDTFPYLVCAPTMRIPGKLPEGSINAYLAMRAILIELKKFNSFKPRGIQSVALPSLCTGVGGLSYLDSAKQMRMAFEMIMYNKFKQVLHPALAPYSQK